MSKKFADREINEKIYKLAGLSVSEHLANKGQKNVNSMIEDFTGNEESFKSPEEASEFLEKNANSFVQEPPKNAPAARKNGEARLEKSSTIHWFFLLVIALAGTYFYMAG